MQGTGMKQKRMASTAMQWHEQDHEQGVKKFCAHPTLHNQET
jgi:hypothetical protein